MKKKITDFNLNGKTVIIRCDLNVPIKDGKILDDNRIKESLKTINYAVENNAKVIILSHLGRVKSKEDLKDKSLKNVGIRLSELLNKPVKFVPETHGTVLEDAIKNMKNKDIVLVENTRFEDLYGKKESSNDENLGKYWAKLGDIFINDAFGTIHRSHASNVGIASNIPSGIGFLVEKEIYMLSKLLNDVKRPYLVIMGGSKVSDKIKLIDKFVCEADFVLLGGGIANTFLKAKGLDVKKSIYDEDSIDYCKDILDNYSDKIILPTDGYASYEFKDEKAIYTLTNSIKEDLMLLDIGPKTIEIFKNYIDKARTIFLNGPVGVSEFENFSYGTKSLLELLKNSDADVIIGGGDSSSSAIKFGYKNSFYHISTGGGASLEFILKNNLPGLDIIEDK